MGHQRLAAVTPSSGAGSTVLLQWASETGAHGMPVPHELEGRGWHRLAEHPIFHGTWLMETPEAVSAPPPAVTKPDPRRSPGAPGLTSRR
jgi:hypothetical protein